LGLILGLVRKYIILLRNNYLDKSLRAFQKETFQKGPGFV